MREKLYKKEILLTIAFSIFLLLMGHTATLFVLFPGLQAGTFWGFPTQYIIPILTGWFGLAVVCWAMTIFCNNFDDEMDAYTSGLKIDTNRPVEQTISAKGGK